MKDDQLRARIGNGGMYILLALLRDGPLHGWGIRGSVQDITGGTADLPLTTIYSGLRRLMDLGLIDMIAGEPSASGPDRKLYRVNGVGAKVAMQEVDRATTIAAALRGLIPVGLAGEVSV